MTVNAIPTPTPFPIQFGQRDAKVIETATLAAGTLSNKALDASCTYDAAPVIADGTLALAKLAAGITPSHIVKFLRTGITGTALAGLLVNDIVVKWKQADASVDVAPVTVADTLPAAAAALDYVIVFRAAA